MLVVFGQLLREQILAVRNDFGLRGVDSGRIGRRQLLAPAVATVLLQLELLD